MFFKNKQFNILLVLLLVLLVLVFISMQVKTTSRMEEFTSDDNIQAIKTGVETIDKKLSTGYPDMSKFALKSQLDPSRVFKVADAVATVVPLITMLADVVSTHMYDDPL